MTYHHIGISKVIVACLCRFASGDVNINMLGSIHMYPSMRACFFVGLTGSWTSGKLILVGPKSNGQGLLNSRGIKIIISASYYMPLGICLLS